MWKKCGTAYFIEQKFQRILSQKYCSYPQTLILKVIESFTKLKWVFCLFGMFMSIIVRKEINLNFQSFYIQMNIMLYIAIFFFIMKLSDHYRRVQNTWLTVPWATTINWNRLKWLSFTFCIGKIDQQSSLSIYLQSHDGNRSKHPTKSCVTIQSVGRFGILWLKIDFNYNRLQLSIFVSLSTSHNSN